MSFSLGGDNQLKSPGEKKGANDAGNKGYQKVYRGGFRGRGSFRGGNRGRLSFNERGGQDSVNEYGSRSFRGNSRGRGSFRGVQRGRGSFRGVQRGRGSFRGEHRGRGSFRGVHRGRGSFRGVHRGRGSFQGERGGRGSSHGEHKGKGSDHDDNVRTGIFSQSSRCFRLGFKFIMGEESIVDICRKRLRKDKIYEKVKHLFEDLKSDSFPNKLKAFNDQSLPEAIELLSSYHGRYEKDVCESLEKVVENLPPPTLKEALIAAKYNILNHCRDGIIGEIKDRSFPRKFPHYRLVLEMEMKELSGADPYFFSWDLAAMLSPTGKCIVKTRIMDYFYNIHQKAADYLVEHPELYQKNSLGTLQL